MGSDDSCLQPNGHHINGLLPNKAASVTRLLDTERWTRAEERSAELIAHIQPDQPSWEHRNAIASYVQRLISQCISCVVLSYGSVPLKTYLPDGDIDLTVFSQDRNCNDNWATDVRDILEKEEKNKYAEYCIREVQLIHAEVKLVKCLVDNIVVDISFGQISGLCTLCFLEEVDRNIGQNHLFKRSIILIKAWCYYESRLLGAYHGLISTYALETLILYIFRVFNNSFIGPLEVLYRFLEFFSKFDWDNFCISLLGPVPVGSLPDMTADSPRQDGDELLLSDMFLNACSFYYSVLPSTHVKEQFVSKHFNIIDFLRTNNNLGRSVSKGNFFRIRSAFAFGAQRLAGLLDCPKECVLAELNRFFMNTWDRHGKVHRPDTHTLHASNIGHEESAHVVLKRNIKENSMAFGAGDVRHHGNRMSSHGGEENWQPEVLQNELQSGHQFARTCSSPELTNESSKLPGESNSSKERKHQDNNISGKTGHSKAEDSSNIKFNTVGLSTRENSPSESYDGDVDTASTSSRYAGDYVVGEDISCGGPIQNFANVMHSPWIETFGRQLAGLTSPAVGPTLNFGYPQGPPSLPSVGSFKDDLPPKSSNKQVDDHGLWNNGGFSSIIEQNTENGFLGSEYIVRNQKPDDNTSQRPANDFAHCQEFGRENAVPYSDAETTLPPIASPHVGAPPFPIANMNYPTPNLGFHVTSVPLNPCWPAAANNYPPFPVPVLPAGSAGPYVSLPYSTYSSHFIGKGHNLYVRHSGPSLDTASKSFHQSLNSSKCKMINEIGSSERSEECTSDILTGDITSHVSNMLYGRSFQNLQFRGPLAYHQSVVQSPYLQGNYLIGDPRMSSVPTENDTLLSHHHGSQRSSKGAYHYYPEGIPGYCMGTGTYFPNPKSSRDFQAPNSRYQRGNCRYQRKEQHREREVSSDFNSNSNFNSRPRFGGRSRKWDKPNLRYDRLEARNHRTRMQWESYDNYCHPTYHHMGYDPTYMVYSCQPNLGYVSLEHPPDYANSSPDQSSSPRPKESLIV